MSPIINLFLLGLVSAHNVLAGAVPPLGPATIPLGTALTYTIVSQTGVSTVPASAITGDVAVSPAASTYLTGFSLILDPTTTSFSTSSQVNGKLYAASYSPPTPAKLTVLTGDVNTAYNDGVGRSNPNFNNLRSGAIGGIALTPGLYKWDSAVTAATGFTICGGPTDTWIFQIAGTLGITANQIVTLNGGALPQNIFWVVAEAINIGAGAVWQGNILAKTSVTVQTGGTVHGRILSQTNVALQMATVKPT